MQALTKLLRSGGYRLWHLNQTYYYSVAIFCLSVLIFYLILALPVVTDIQYHVSILQNWINGRSILPATFLYYLTVYALSFFQDNTHVLLTVSALVLAASITLKFIITRKIIYVSIKESGKVIYSWDWISIFSLLLILAFSLPAVSNSPNWMYIGQIPPNVWHNSTTIFLMPFALLLFWNSYKQLENPQNNRIWVLFFLGVINTLIKPSFFFVFGIVYPLLLALKIGMGGRFWLNMLAILPGLLIIATEYYFIYAMSGNATTLAQADVKISPFTVWAHYSANIPLSLIASFFFPLVYLSFYWKQIAKNQLLQYAVLLQLVAISFMVMLSETGGREFHGNFFWQAIICNYLLFMVIGCLMFKKILVSGKLEKKDALIISALLIHVICGATYLGRLFITKNFL